MPSVSLIHLHVLKGNTIAAGHPFEECLAASVVQLPPFMGQGPEHCSERALSELSTYLTLSKTKPAFCPPRMRDGQCPKASLRVTMAPQPTAAAMALLRPLECLHNPDKILPTFKVQLQSHGFQKVPDSGTLFLQLLSYNI